MKRSLSMVIVMALAAAGAPGCSCSAEVIGSSDGFRADLSGADLTFPPGSDLSGIDFAAAQNECGTNGPGCQVQKFGPPNKPFPLQSDPQPDPNESDNGVDRDNDGFIILSTSKANFDFVYAANSADWGIGTVSKIHSKSVKEVARYFTVTCFSNPMGSRAACDGTKGCCSRDDHASFTRRVAMMPSGPHQAVQTTNNIPSRTAVDFNGDMWVANRAFGGQSSVTKIANDKTQCMDRNGTPGIQTSSDVNGDGSIDSDCNRNGVPDDVADVRNTPCQNGKPQEFYGLDDECVLFTTNTDSADQYGRPLALGRGSVDFGPADAWAGTYRDCRFFRVDGTTGMMKAQAKMPGTDCYGATVDASGILWSPGVASPRLYYFDTGNPVATGQARTASFGTDAYGIAMDRDQNVWIGGYPSGNAYRYTPDRSNAFAKLGQGWWTRVRNPGGGTGQMDIGRGIAADSRTPQTFFVWMGRHPNWIVRINASAIPKPMGADVDVDGSGMPAIRVAGDSPAGAGVDTDQNVWAIASGGSVATRIKVDQNGNMMQPDIAGGQNGVGCPAGAGDRCPLRFAANPDPVPYTYSDFTGFGLRNFTNPKGAYAYVQRGCDQNETRWLKVVWDADVPAATKLTLRARSGPTPVPDNAWGPWTGDYAVSPGDLKGPPGPVMPNPAPYLQVEFDLSTMDRTSTPRLRSFQIVYECGMKVT